MNSKLLARRVHYVNVCFGYISNRHPAEEVTLLNWLKKKSEFRLQSEF